MKRIGLTASEEMSFENVDRRRTDDGYLYNCTKSSPMRLKNTEKRSRHRFLHDRVLIRSLPKPSAAFPYLTLHAIIPQVSEIFLFESVDKRHTHVRTDGRRLVSYHIGSPCHHSDPVSKKSSKQGLQRFS